MTPSPMRMALRGLRAHCPWCGAGRVFAGPIKIKQRCPRCGLRFEPEAGDYLGSATLAYGVAAAAWMVMLVVWLAIDLPGVAIVPLSIASVVTIVGVGLACTRPAKTTWSALSLILSGAHRGLEPHDAEKFGIDR